MSLKNSPGLTPLRRGSCWSRPRVAYFLEHYRKMPTKLLSPVQRAALTSMWDFRRDANSPQVLEPFQKLSSTTFEMMHTEKLDLKPQH